MLATLLLNATAVVPPEQKLCDAGVAVADGVGLMITVAVDEAPLQDPIVGAMVYTTEPVDVPVALSACEITVPLPALAPLTPLCATVQV